MRGCLVAVLTERVELETGWAVVRHDGTPDVRLGDRLVPRRVELHFPGAGGSPSLIVGLEVVDGRPECRAIHMIAAPNSREIRDADLNGMRLADWTVDAFAIFAKPIVSEENGVVTAVRRVDEGEYQEARRNLTQARKGAPARKVTNALLEQVAEIYRRNLADRPTQAVERSFGVGRRQAAAYVSRARQAGFLGQTTRGKKGV